MNSHEPRGTTESPIGTSPADAALEISRFGSAILRDVWDPQHLATLREAITGFCDRRAELVAQGMVDPMMREYHEMGTTVLTWLIFEGLIDLSFFAGMFRGSFYHELCKIHFDDDQLYMAPDRIGSRNIKPPYSSKALLPFHQDSVEQDPRIQSVLNAWIPLDSGAGLTAPGVEVLRDPGRPNFPLRKNVPAASGPDYAGVGIDYDDIISAYDANFLAPTFELGDSIVFSQDVIHRTHVTEEMTKPRIGFEFRVFSLKHLAPRASKDEVAFQSYPLC